MSMILRRALWVWLYYGKAVKRQKDDDWPVRCERHKAGRRLIFRSSAQKGMAEKEQNMFLI